MKTFLGSTVLLAILAGCGGEDPNHLFDEPSPDLVPSGLGGSGGQGVDAPAGYGGEVTPSAESDRAFVGAVFEASFAAPQVATSWSWQLGGWGREREAGRCEYENDAMSQPTGKWSAHFSNDLDTRDPTSGDLYANGYWTVVGTGTFVQTPSEVTPSATYGCSDRSLVLAEVEFVLGLLPDGVNATGFVRRIHLHSIGAPIDATTTLPVVLELTAPVPLSIRGTVQPFENGVELSLKGDDDAPPAFTFSVRTGVLGMLGLSRIELRGAHLVRAAD